MALNIAEISKLLEDIKPSKAANQMSDGQLMYALRWAEVATSVCAAQKGAK